MIWLTVIGFIVVWVAFNVAAAYAPLLLSERISPGRLPTELLARGEARRVRFYVGTCVSAYAFSSWAPPLWTVVVFDRRFFRQATPALLRFVVAHELGHAANGHHVLRWCAVVSGAALLPAVRRALARQEEQADAYATFLTGFKKEHFREHFSNMKG